MKKFLTALLFFCCVVNFSFAQLENANWYFGDSCALKFTTSGVVPILTSKMRSYKSSASISDSLGNLLFYTQSQTVWNRNNDTMENGFGIKPHPVMPIGSDWVVSGFSQGALVIPYPEQPGLYYLFSLATLYDSTLAVSVIDMNQNGGFGKVIEKNRFIYIDTLFCEQFTAIKHGNGRDYWLITHKGLSQTFIKFLVTPDSIIGPIFQTIGNSLDDQYYGGIGQSVFSPLGNKYLVVNDVGILKLFDFDRCSGEFTSMVDLSSSPYPYNNNRLLYGCSFSPDGHKIYVSDKKRLYQYDLDSSNIISTKDTIWNNSYSNYIIGAQLLGIDNRIYFTNVYSTVPNSFYSVHQTHLCLIDSPNNKGINCHVIIDTISLGGKRVIGGLPNTINYSLGSLEGSACDTLNSVTVEINQKSIIRIYPNPAQDELTIEILNGIAPKEIDITNALGVTVIKLKQTKPNQQVNIKSLISGVYFVKVKMQDGSITILKSVKK